MNNRIDGIHHITAIASDPQQNVDFYVGILGLRLVKRTVNFDAPDTYHLYYGDGSGTPGSILTFFPWGYEAWRGRAGTGQVTVISFSIPDTSMGYWIDHLKKYDMSIQGPFQRFDTEGISFRDPDGIQLELISDGREYEPGWTKGDIPPEHTLRGFYGATLSLEGYERTAGLLTKTMNFKQVSEKGNRFRFKTDHAEIGKVVDLICLPNGNDGRMGAGAVHHIAWRIDSDATQLKKREELIGLGYDVTPVMDRNYFSSIYFREPGHVLFEIATDPPGFFVDESPEELGKNLKLPAWYESRRKEIENQLSDILLPD
jgi:glyoxalase family protein